MTSSFFYKKDGILQRISLDEILLLEASENYVRFFGHSVQYIVRTTLEAALNKLPRNMFARINRSQAIRIDQIETIEKDHLTLLTVKDGGFPVSKKYYRSLLAKVNIIDGGTDESAAEEKPEEPGEAAE